MSNQISNQTSVCTYSQALIGSIKNKNDRPAIQYSGSTTCSGSNYLEHTQVPGSGSIMPSNSKLSSRKSKRIDNKTDKNEFHPTQAEASLSKSLLKNAENNNRRKKMLSYSQTVSRPCSKPEVRSKNSVIPKDEFYQLMEKAKLPVLEKWKTSYEAYLYFLENPGSFCGGEELFFVQQICFYLFSNRTGWGITAFEYMIKHYQHTNNLRIFEKLSGVYIRFTDELIDRDLKKEGERKSVIAKNFIEIFKSKAKEFFDFISDEKLGSVGMRLIEMLCFMSKSTNDYSCIDILHSLNVSDKFFDLIETIVEALASGKDQFRGINVENFFTENMYCGLRLIDAYHYKKKLGDQGRTKSIFLDKQKKHLFQILNSAESAVSHLKEGRSRSYIVFQITRLLLKNDSVFEEQMKLSETIVLFEKKINELKKIKDDFDGRKEKYLGRMHNKLVELYSLSMYFESNKERSENIIRLLEKFETSINNLSQYEMSFKSCSELEGQLYELNLGCYLSAANRYKIKTLLSPQDLSKKFSKEIDENIDKLDELLTKVDSLVRDTTKDKKIYLYRKERLVIEKILWLLSSGISEKRSKAENLLRQTCFISQMGKKQKAELLYTEFNDHAGAIQLLENLLLEYTKPKSVYRTYQMLAICYHDRCYKDNCNAHNDAKLALHYAYQAYLMCTDKSFSWGVYARACEALRDTNQSTNELSNFLPKELEDYRSSWGAILGKIFMMYKRKIDSDVSCFQKYRSLGRKAVKLKSVRNSSVLPVEKNKNCR